MALRVDPAEKIQTPPGSTMAADGVWLPDSLGEWLIWGWFAGTGLFVSVQGRRLIHLHLLRRAGRPATSEFRNEVAQVAGELSVVAPGVEVVPGLSSPALCACGPVALLWPESSCGALSATGRRAVLLHELAHLKRRDHWVGWLELLAGCGWWWNPLFWYVRHQLHENAELSCDAWVVARLPEGRRAYAEALIDVAEGVSMPQLSGVVLGVGDGSRKLLERRLVMIMRGHVRTRIPVIGLVAIALVAVATLPRWSIAENAAGAEQPDPAVSQRNAEVRVDSLDSGNMQAAYGIALDEVAVEGSPSTAAGGAIGVSTAPPKRDLRSDNSGEPLPASGPNVVSDTERLAKLEAQLNSVLEKLASLERSYPSKLIGTAAPGGAQQPATHEDPLSVSGLGRGGSVRVPGGLAPGATTIASPSRPKSGAGKPGSSASVGAASFTFVADNNVAGRGRQTGGRAGGDIEGADDVEIEKIIRATYKLPKGMADRLARMLSEIVGGELVFKVKGDTLQVTASAEDQLAIHHLILLIQRQPKVEFKASAVVDPAN
jgi:beta-lactamase regulating signal transducer with metallopeptidase domain